MTQTQQAKHTPGIWQDMADTLKDVGFHPGAVNALMDAAIERDRLKALNAELLAALKRMIEAYREGVQDDREPLMVHQAIAAIAKAEGR